jgi:hypothetical protein
MFAMILRTHWAWTRLLVGAVALLAFLMPAFAWRISKGYSDSVSVLQLMDGLSVLGPMLGFLALFGSFVLAVYPWTLDAETKHVYPLALPVSWTRYVGMRYASGALTLLVPTLALYIGCRFALSLITLPPMLQAYPGALAVRFLLAALVAYSASFALQYLAGRRAALVALLVVLGFAVALTVLELSGAKALSDAIGVFFFDFPGPFGVFTQSWVLIDV